MSSQTSPPASLKKKRKQNKASKFVQGVGNVAGKIGSIASTLAPLLELAPMLLARHPEMCNHPKVLAATKGVVTPIQAPAAISGSMSSNTSFKSRSVKGGKMRVHAQDLIGTVAIDGNENLNLQGTPLFVTTLDPYSPAFEGTRTQLLARSYQQWRIISCKVIYVPMAPTSAVGVIAMMTTTDPDETIPESGLNAVKAVMSHEGATEFPIWMPAGCAYQPVKDRVFYSSTSNGLMDELTSTSLAGVEARQTSAGQIGVFAAADLYPYSDGANTYRTLGQILIDWELEFSVPVAENKCDYTTFAKAITAAGGSGVSINYVLGAITAAEGGWGTNWKDDYPVDVTSNFVPKNNLPIMRDLSTGSTLYNFPSGIYLSVLYGNGLTGTGSASAATCTGEYRIITADAFFNTASAKFTSWAIFYAPNQGGADVGTFKPVNFGTAPTGVGVDDMRIFIGKFGNPPNVLLPPGLAGSARSQIINSRRDDYFRSVFMSLYKEYSAANIVPPDCPFIPTTDHLRTMADTSSNSPQRVASNPIGWRR